MSKSPESLRSLCLHFVACRLHISGQSPFRLPLPLYLRHSLHTRSEEIVKWLERHETILPRVAVELLPILCYEGGNSDRIDARRSAEVIIDADCVSASDKYRLCAMYCLETEAQLNWDRCSWAAQQEYLAEMCDPIVNYWTGVCGGRRWLAESYVVRAFYQAAQKNCADAFRYFWLQISRERPEAVRFRAVRAFQLAAHQGNMDILTRLWEAVNNQEYRQLLIQGVLCSTPGAMYAFEGAARGGHVEIVRFLFREATYEQALVMLRANDCEAFRNAAKHGHLDIVQLFLERASRARYTKELLEASNCGAFNDAVAGGYFVVADTLLQFASLDNWQLMLRHLFHQLSQIDEQEAKSNFINNLWTMRPEWQFREIIVHHYLVPLVRFQCANLHNSTNEEKTDAVDGGIDNTDDAVERQKPAPFDVDGIVIGKEIGTAPSVEEAMVLLKQNLILDADLDDL